MSETRRSVCLISGGLVEKNIRLQPWRYLHEIARQLIHQGHEVTILSDGHRALVANNGSDNNGSDNETVGDLSVQRLGNVSRPRLNLPRLMGSQGSSNQALTAALQEIQPDVILWHVGLTSFLHQQIDGWPDVPIVGIFTSPMYQFADLRRIGMRKIVKNRALSAIHVAGTLLPNTMVGSAINRGLFDQIVVQTQTTRDQLVTRDVNAKHITVIEPGVDAGWFRSVETSHPDLSQPGTGPDTGQKNGICPSVVENRKTLGYTPEEKVVLYYGSPAPLRGLHTLIRAIEIAHQQDESIRLLVLSRRHANQLMAEDKELHALLSRSDIQETIRVIDGFLEPETLVEFVNSADVVALPFELVPSDAPLSLLESKALGKPIVTTNVACLPELAAGGSHYIAEPADPVSLAQALLQAVADLPASHPYSEKFDTEKSSIEPSICHTDSKQPVSKQPVSKQPIPKQIIPQAEAPYGTPLRKWEEVGKEWSHLVQDL